VIQPATGPLGSRRDLHQGRTSGEHDCHSRPVHDAAELPGRIHVVLIRQQVGY
jgi:hypothetical protein